MLCFELGTDLAEENMLLRLHWAHRLLCKKEVTWTNLTVPLERCKPGLPTTVANGDDSGSTSHRVCSSCVQSGIMVGGSVQTVQIRHSTCGSRWPHASTQNGMLTPSKYQCHPSCSHGFAGGSKPVRQFTKVQGGASPSPLPKRRKALPTSALYVPHWDTSNVAIVSVDLDLDQHLANVDVLSDNVKRRNLEKYINVFRLVTY